MTQLEWIAKFNEEHKEKFNPELFVRSDDEIMDQLQKVIKSCERNNSYFSIEVKRFRVIDDYKDMIKDLVDRMVKTVRMEE